MLKRALLLWLASVSAHAAALDGPYALAAGRGWDVVTLEPSAKGPVPHRATVATDATLTIPAVNEVPAFRVRLRGPAKVAAEDIKTAANTPLFVVADTHGEYEILVAQLQKHQVIDARLRWSFGKGRLVVLGDVFDRGPNHLEILWLLYQLEAEAAKAGGGVHLVLGNHELMVLSGDLRYLNPKYAETAAALGLTYPRLFAADTLLGQWLRTRATVMKVNGNLCMHAGVSRALLDSGLALPDVNATVRAVLTRSGPLQLSGMQQAELVTGQLGPLWYRGYFPDQANFPPATMADVDRTLKTFGAKRILVGHTRVPVITSLYDGKVIAVQVYPERAPDGVHFESLLIRGDSLSRASLSGLQPLTPRSSAPP